MNKLFKSLGEYNVFSNPTANDLEGCKISKLGERERARLGLADSTADEKRAVLTAPVEFPKPRLKNLARK